MAWLSNDWTYRRGIIIDNTSNSNDLTDYQVKITLDNTNFDFSHANSDGSDIRFTDNDGSTLLYHWIEKWDSTNQEAIIWVKVPSIPGSSTKTIYMYYGNASASDASDGDNTFIVFDDFDGADLDTNKWNIVQGSVSVSDSCLILTGTSSTRGLIESVTSFSIGKIVQSKARSDSNNCFHLNHFCSMRSPGSWNNKVDLYGYIDNANQVMFHTAKDGNETQSTIDINEPSSFHIYKVSWKPDEAKAYQDDTLLKTHTTNIPTVDMVVAFYEANASGYNAYIDYVFVREFTDPEPTTSVGNETTNYAISGQVTLEGNPVENAKVRAICQDDNSYAGDTTTDENGNYKIEGLLGSKKYHIIVEYTDPDTGQKYNAESKWDITPVEESS